MRELVLSFVLSLTLLDCILSVGQIQAFFWLSNEGTIFTPQNHSEQPLQSTSTPTQLRCTHQCLAEIDCRTFVYDPVTLSCQLHRTDLLTGTITFVASPSKSRVGVIEYNDLVSYYNRSCRYCRWNPYLTCQSDRCQCSWPESMWNGLVCQRRALQNESCSSSVACRQDLNLTCVFSICTNDTSIYSKNWLINGDAEIGPCSFNDTATPPTVWSYNGTAIQMSYNTTVDGPKYFSPGPSDRGNCYFANRIASVNYIWQYVNMTSTIKTIFIDNGTLRFTLSAWLGGFVADDDNAQIFLSFQNQLNATVGNTTTIGPVLAADRGNITSLLFRQTYGLVPASARYAQVRVSMSRTAGAINNAVVDNMVLLFYQ